MKIGILSLPLNTNYGGILQAYALQTILEKMGHDVFLLDNNNYRTLPSVKEIIKRIYWKYFKRCDVEVFYENRHNREYPILSANIYPFIKKYIKRKTIKSFSELDENSFDAYVVGSDQIWRRVYFLSMWQWKLENAFLSFATNWNVKKIAYAASFGIDTWDYTTEETGKCRNLISDFCGVSVREDSAIGLCKDYFGYDAELVLDPTLLLQKEDYMYAFDIESVEKSNGTLLNYILDKDAKKINLVNRIAKERGLEPFRVNAKSDNPSAPIQDRIQPPVESWLRGFYDAEFVVTDSFHACVFAILFRKPFVAVGNSSRGMTRFASLLGLFDLEDHLIIDASQYSPSFSYQIPDNVYVKLELLRSKSISFLCELLCK